MYLISDRCRCASSFFFQAEDGIRDLVRSRGLGDVYKRQVVHLLVHVDDGVAIEDRQRGMPSAHPGATPTCNLSLIHI